MAERVKEVAVGEVDRIKHLTTDAARSAAYLYPIRVSLKPFNNCVHCIRGSRMLMSSDLSRALRTSFPTRRYGSHSRASLLQP